MITRRTFTGATLAGMALLASASLLQAATTADVIFVVDESGSMSGEHAWLSGMVTSLDSELIGNGVTGNQYALVGYGAANGGGHTVAGHKHTVGGGDFGTAAQLSAATAGLVTSGGTEDGWEAIDFALDNYAFRGGAAVNIILVTDENRDNINAALTKAGVLAKLQAKNALLNVVVDNPFTTSGGATALGVDKDLNAYQADGAGGYTSSAGGVIGNGNGNTEDEYVDLALQSGGAAWDLNQLRAGGLTADSFTAAFVDIKAKEIVTQPTPDAGSTLALLGAGLTGLVFLRRRCA